MARYAVCRRCGKPFRRTHNGQRYCSAACREQQNLENGTRAHIAARERAVARQRERSGALVIRPRPDLAAAEAFARAQRGTGRHPGADVVGSTRMRDGL